ATRLKTERAAGIYSTDVSLGGLTNAINDYRPGGWADPIKPVLLLPEVTDPKKWINGKVWFSDPEERDYLRITNQARPLMAVNAKYIDPASLKVANDLLDPRLKGKMVCDDPTRGGSGNNFTCYLWQK